MAVSAIHNIDAHNVIANNLNTSTVTTDNNTAFDSLLNSAVNMYKETDDLQNAAEQSEINFALGYSTSTHDLAIAQQKANIALQYTVRVTNKALEAYKELMNMQI
jgi:flagellar hook-basal body complex protein FliE